MPSSTTYSAISVAIRRTISRRCATAVTSRTVTRSSISRADSVPATSSRRSLYRSSVASAWLARDRIAEDSSRTRRSPCTYSAISRIDWETETTGKPHALETRSAVRCRVPVSSVGIEASGTSCTPARRIFVMSLSRISAPSSLHSSRRRVAVNSTSSTNPPVHIDSTVLSMPSTIRPPVLPRRMRSRPSRRAIPGATALSEARISASLPVPWPDFPGVVARSLAATALLRSQVCGALASAVPCPRAGETRAKSTGARRPPVVPPGESGAGGPAERRPCRRLP